MTDPATAEGGVPWKGRKATRVQPSSREIKMLRPVCRTCEDDVGGAKFLPTGWWNDCTHDPYIAHAEVSREVPVYETDDEGVTRVIRTDTVVEIRSTPNWTSVTQAKGFNSGKGPQIALLKGFIYPQQLRSPEFPKGISRRCQFRECYEGEGLKKYNSGWFCREMEAKMVRVSDLEQPLRIGQFSEKAEMLRQEQLERVKV